MPNYITIYLQSQLESLNIEEVRKGISSADWWTLAEDFGIEEDEVDRFINDLQWEKEPLQFLIPNSRPVQIHVLFQREAVQEEIREIRQKDLPHAVNQFCNNVQSVVILEMGFSQSKTMLEIVAFEIAYWLAEAHCGLIKSLDGHWFDHDKNRWKPIK